MEERGFRVYNLDEIAGATDHLPKLPEMPDLSHFKADDLIAKSLDNVKESEHPFYHERTCYSYHKPSRQVSLCWNYQLHQVLSMTNSIVPGPGLPFDIPKVEQDETKIASLVKESFICDAWQKKLPRRIRVPFTGYHPVNNQMASKVPYEVKFLYQRGEPTRFGIPVRRSIETLIRNFLRRCRLLDASREVDDFNHMEHTLIRQFFERHGKLVRIFLPIQNLLTASKPIKPFDVDSEHIKDLRAPDLAPMNSLIKMDPINVYRQVNNFPVLSSEHPRPHVTMGVDATYAPEQRFSDYRIAAESLIRAFTLALGQVRLFEGDLQRPIVIPFVFTTGDKFHFSVFQLNSLDLEDPTKVNYFWHEEQTTKLFDMCQFQEALPVLEGLNCEAFDKFYALYNLGNARS